MNYADYTRDTKEPLKRVAHARRYSQIARLIARPSEGDTVLDYGCGDAHLFSHFLNGSMLVGYDPNPVLLAQASAEVADGSFLSTDMEEIKSRYSNRCSVIYCIEVCEHLTLRAMDELFSNIRGLAAPNATIIFGVPIETGPAGFLKSIYRMSYGRQSASIALALKSLFGFQIERQITDIEWYGAHTGFDHRAFRSLLLQNGFAIIQERCLPVPGIGAVLNNEIYFVTKLEGLM